MTDTEVLDWIEAHPTYTIASDLRTEELSRGPTIREAVRLAHMRTQYARKDING